MRARTGVKRRNNLFQAILLSAVFVIATSCGGGGGGGGGGSTAQPPAITPPATGDTTAPSIVFTFPADGAEFTMPSIPSHVDVAYSDTSGSVTVSTLDVSFKLNGRTVSLTDLFGKDAALNKSSSTTSGNLNDPLLRMPVSIFTSAETTFANPLQTLSIDRKGSGAASFSCVAGTQHAYVWNPADSAIYSISLTGTPSSSAVALGFAPSAFEDASDKGKFYVAKSGAAAIYVYNSNSSQLLKTVALADEPALIAYHPETGKLYIAYKNQAKLARLDAQTDALDAYSVSVAAVPALLQTRRGQSTGGVFTIIATGGKFHLIEYDAAGSAAPVRDVQLGLAQPSDMEFVTSGYVYLSNFSSNTVTRVSLADNSSADIAAGQFPKKIFSGGSAAAYVMNSGGKTMTLIQGAAASANYQFSSLPLDGSSACSSGQILTLEDIWSIATRTPATLTATIKDPSGNTGTVSITIYVKPESLGGV